MPFVQNALQCNLNMFIIILLKVLRKIETGTFQPSVNENVYRSLQQRVDAIVRMEVTTRQVYRQLYHQNYGIALTVIAQDWSKASHA